MQEVWVKAFRGLNKFRGDSALGSWLYQITYRACIDFKAKKRPEVSSIDQNEGFEGLHLADPHHRQDPERQSTSSWLRKQIQSAVQKLSPKERTIFILRHDQQHSCKETARLVGCSEGSVKSILFRAMRKLQNELAHLRGELGNGEGV